MSRFDDRAECKGEPLSTFFKDAPGDASWVSARELCGRCPVQAECLVDAVTYEKDFDVAQRRYMGFVGGLTARQRIVFSRLMQATGALPEPEHPRYRTPVTEAVAA